MIEPRLVSAYRCAMPAVPELKQMTLVEKLQLMEALWDDLCRSEEELPVPDWQKALLDGREGQVAGGCASFDDWEAAKARIAKRVL